jgi:CRP-like cAMP-binding protein
MTHPSQETTIRHRYMTPAGMVRHVHRVGRPVRDPYRSVRTLLTALDITQVEVARLAGLTPAHVNRVLHGRYPASDRLVDVISELVGYDRGVFRRILGEPR